MCSSDLQAVAAAAVMAATAETAAAVAAMRRAAAVAAAAAHRSSVAAASAAAVVATATDLQLSKHPAENSISFFCILQPFVIFLYVFRHFCTLKCKYIS